MIRLRGSCVLLGKTQSPVRKEGQSQRYERRSLPIGRVLSTEYEVLSIGGACLYGFMIGLRVSRVLLRNDHRYAMVPEPPVRRSQGSRVLLRKTQAPGAKQSHPAGSGWV